MKHNPFSTILDNIMNQYQIENKTLAQIIDRSPSRIRHWRNDCIPGKKIIDFIIDSILDIISQMDNQRTNKRCIRTCNSLLENMDSPIEKRTFDDIESYITYVLKETFQLTSDKALIASLNNKDVFEIKINNSIKLADKEFNNGYHNKGIESFQRILDNNTFDKHLSLQVTLHYKIALSYRYLGIVEGSIEIINKGIKSLENGLALCEVKDKQYSEGYKHMGTMYQSRAFFTNPIDNMDKALLAYTTAMNSINSKTQKVDYYKILNNIGILYLELAQYKNSKLNFEKSLEIFNTIIYENLPKSCSELYERALSNAIAGHYRMMIISDPISHFSQAVELGNRYFDDNQFKDNPSNYVRFTDNMALIYLEKGRYSKDLEALKTSIDYIQTSLMFYEEESHLLAKANSLLALSNVYHSFYEINNDLKEFKKANSYLDQAEELYVKIDDQVNLMKLEFNRIKLSLIRSKKESNLEGFDQCISRFNDLKLFFNINDYPEFYYQIEYELAKIYYMTATSFNQRNDLNKSKDLFTSILSQFPVLSNPLMHSRIIAYLDKIKINEGLNIIVS